MGVWLHRTYYGGSHYRLSANASAIEDPERQIRERERVLERLAPQAYPDDREVAFLWEKLAVTAIQQERFHTALEAYRGAVRTEPSRWDRMKPLGYLEAEIGDREAGIRALRRYLERAPRDAEAWLFLGDALVGAGSFAPAREAYRRFLELDPAAPEAPRVREELARLGE
jgi:cytochrome c-type biogenesis protein CcmH/NrfG